jgi:hypothetical protein
MLLAGYLDRYWGRPTLQGLCAAGMEMGMGQTCYSPLDPQSTDPSQHVGPLEDNDGSLAGYVLYTYDV